MRLPGWCPLVAGPTELDLSRQRPGVYVVEVRTATGVARQQAVVE